MLYLICVQYTIKMLKIMKDEVPRVHVSFIYGECWPYYPHMILKL